MKKLNENRLDTKAKERYGLESKINLGVSLVLKNVRH